MFEIDKMLQVMFEVVERVLGDAVFHQQGQVSDSSRRKKSTFINWKVAVKFYTSLLSQEGL